MTDDIVLVFATASSREEGIGIAERLVDERLAACVNVLPGARSIYMWQGARDAADEAVLIMKTRRDRYPALEARLRDLHSYEVPEIIAVPVVSGSPAYLAWVRDTTAPRGGESSP